MRTVPRMVARDFSETSGSTLRRTVGASGLAFAGEDVARVAGAVAGATLDFAVDGTDTEFSVEVDSVVRDVDLPEGVAPELGVDKSAGAELT